MIYSNRAPFCRYIAHKSIEAGTKVSFAVNANDPDGDAITFKQDTNLANSSFVNKLFSWTPSINEIGLKNVVFRATDSKGAYSTITVKINVTNPSNKPPVFNNVPDQNIEVGRIFTLNVSATDPEGDMVKILLNNPVNGVTFKDNILTWTPGSNQIATYSFKFTASDSKNLQAEKIIKISVVSRKNNPPYIAAFYNASKGLPYAIPANI